MTGDSRSQPSTASAKCRHDVSEDCPACMADEIARLTSSLAAADARGKRLEEALREIEACPLIGYYLNGEETWQQLARQIVRFNSELQKRVKLSKAALSQTEEGR